MMRRNSFGAIVFLVLGLLLCALSACDSGKSQKEEEARAQYRIKQEKEEKAILAFAGQYGAITDWEEILEDRYGVSFRGASTYVLEEILCVDRPDR